MAKFVETRVCTLDELLFGEIPDTALYSDRQEFNDAQQIFEHAQIGKDFSGTPYWQTWQKPLLEENYNVAAKNLLDYEGLDQKKRDELMNQKNLAKYALDFISGCIDDARNFPRPLKNF